MDQYAIIEDVKVRYQIHGSGSVHMLMIHGAVGSLNDFLYQLDSRCGLNQSEFTIVALDLPGYGKSAPLCGNEERDFGHEAYERDTRVCAKLMSHLKISTYTVCGWNDGARIATLLAIKEQSRVDALILWGFTPFMDEETIKTIGKTRDVSIWDEEALRLYSRVYDGNEQEFSIQWRKYVDYMMGSIESQDQFDIRDQLHKIKCPTLIFYGNNDPLVSYNKHVKPVVTNINDSDVCIFKGASHNLHQARVFEFNQKVTSFVTSIKV